MKTQIIILGCGSSVGVPRIDGFWGNCNKKNRKNVRTRTSAIISKGKNFVLIDTSPDLRNQFLSCKIKNISYVLYTHRHADQTHGINELRPFFWKNKKKLNIYGDESTIRYLTNAFSYCFKKRDGYKPILKANIIKKNFSLGLKKERINFETINVKHGKIMSLGYVFEKTAYISDCSDIFEQDLKKLSNLKLLIIDCLRIKKHPSHFNLSKVLLILQKIKPKKTILTNLSHELDYRFLLKNLPRNVKPAYDGLKLII